MDQVTPEANAFLFELYTMTKGDTKTQVSMYEVGEALGLEKTEAGTMAESLFIQGLAEMKTLSGGIGITCQGLEVLEVKTIPESGMESVHLGTGRAVDIQGQKTIERILKDIKAGMEKTSLSYDQIEEMVMDIKTIEIQMLSPRPKTKIIREGFLSLHDNLKVAGPKDLAATLNSLILS